MPHNETQRQEVFAFLDNLHASGVTNMFGATPYLIEAFDFEEPEAKRWLFEWMRTFSERHPRPTPPPSDD